MCISGAGVTLRVGQVKSQVCWFFDASSGREPWGVKNETVNFDVGDESEGVEAPEAAGDAFEVVPLNGARG